ncbi:MAG: response regulator [Candidatus Auribacterota bacterium]|nr:response regulator [Candidatus Auribacterota bacterium]
MTDTAKNTILIVDDSSLIRGSLKRIVNHMGFSVREAENGEVAINILSAFTPTCIISDIRMPIKDGFQVLDFALRQENPVPVILSSSIPFNREELFQRGVKGFLPKPYLMEEAQSLITRVISENNSPNRRRHSRIEIKLPVSFNDLSGDFFRGTSSNLSKRGIKVVLNFNEPSPPRQFSINIYIDDTHFFIRKVEKVWEAMEESNRLSIGCRFDEISDDADAWLEKILPADNLSSDFPAPDNQPLRYPQEINSP